MIDCDVAPLLHNQEEPEDAVNKTLCPWQKVVGPPAVMVAAGTWLTVTVTDGEVLLQLPVVTVTLNVPEPVTVMDCVVAPLLHI